MSDEARRRQEMEAALRQIKNIQKRQARMQERAWRLDVSMPKMLLQGAAVFAVGVLVGLGASVLFQILFP